MTDERFDKLLHVMLDVKGTVGELVQKVDTRAKSRQTRAKSGQT